MLNLFKATRPNRAAVEALPNRAPATPSEPIQITLETTAIERAHAGTLVVGCLRRRHAARASSRRVDLRSKGSLSSVIKLGDLGEQAGSTLLLHEVAGIAADRVLLVSFGPRADFGDKAFRDALDGAAKFLAAGAAEDAVVALADVDVPGRSLAWRAAARRRMLADGAYRFASPWTAAAGNGARRPGARRIALFTSGKSTPQLETARPARPGHRRGHGAREGPRQSARATSAPRSISPTLRASSARVSLRRRGARARRHEKSRHGCRAGGGTGVRPARASSSSCTTRGAARRPDRSCWSAKA